MIFISNSPLEINEIYKVLFKDEKIALDESSLLEVDKSFEFIQEFIKGKVIYGINTGLGSMANHVIEQDLCLQLQYNLIRSHSSGSGNILPEIYVKSGMIARLVTLMRGYSGIHQDALKLFVDLINNNICPLMFQHGGVGASGDLVQLSHLALTMIGEGEVIYQGKRRPTNEVFQEKGIKPLSIRVREGLAIINGTSIMTGIGIINAIMAKNLLQWSIIASAMISEIIETFDDFMSPELNNTKYHIGQNKIVESLIYILKGSKKIKCRQKHFYNKEFNDTIIDSPVQVVYSIRCVPQILGPIFDTIQSAEDIIMKELNSVDDNPIVDYRTENIYHGGNFHGDYISLEMDKLKIAITKLSMLAERQLNFLLNDKINNILPPYVNLGKVGLNFGMQGAQFTATSTVAENQTLSNPMYIHSIPNNNDNQDIVSMGTNAALLTKKVIDNTFEVLSIELITILSAVDYLKIEEKLSDFTRKIFNDLRNIVPKFEADSVMYGRIADIKNHLVNTRLNVLRK